MRTKIYTPTLPTSKPASSQSRERRNIPPTPIIPYKNPMASSIDMLENDMVILQQQKKSFWEDYLIKPPSVLMKKRIKDDTLCSQNQNQTQLQDANAYNPAVMAQNVPLKSSRPQSLGTTKGTQFYTYKKGNDEGNACEIDMSSNIQANQQQGLKGSKNTTGMSFYVNDNAQGLGPTKTKLLENVGKQNFVDYPHKIEGHTPKIWHPKMDNFENKGNEWQMNVDNNKYEEVQQKQEIQKQIRDNTRQTFLAKFNKNLDLDIQIKKNTLQKIQALPCNLGATLNNIQSQPQNQQLIVDRGQKTIIKDDKQIEDQTNQQIVALSATINNLQRYPRQNTAGQQRNHHQQVVCGKQQQIVDDLNGYQAKPQTNRKRVLSTDGYGMHYDYNLLPIGQKGMFVYDGFQNNQDDRDVKIKQKTEDNPYSIQNIDLEAKSSARNQNICKVGNLLRNIQSASVDMRGNNYHIGETIQIHSSSEKLADTINSGMYNTVGKNKLVAYPATTRSERRPLTAAVVEQQNTTYKMNQTKSQTGSRNSPYRDHFEIINNKQIPYNSITDKKNLTSMSKSLQYSLNTNQMVLNSSDINVIDELDKFDEKMEENQKMAKIMGRMHHQSKGFCGITKKENQMLGTVEGFKKVRAKKAQPSYPFCLSFDPF